MADERWFSDEELELMSQPTMDRAIAAIEAGDSELALELCKGMRHEWRFLHDLMAESMLGLVTYVQRKLGDEGVGEAWEETLKRGWQRDTGKILERDRREVVEALAATWRAHSTSGKGENPGAFTVSEDEEKFTFAMNPCGSGQRLWRNGAYEGEDPYGVTEKAHDWSYGREGFPLYCTHCAFMNELLPIRWYGLPLYPSRPPQDFDHDPCVWYWYKQAEDIPDEYWRRYGLQKTSAAGGGIGRSICSTLAEQGWKVAACDLGAGALETAELVRGKGGEALGLTWDVRDGAAAKQAHAEAEKELGPVEAVVANAAIVDRIAPAEKLSEEGWRNEIDVNLTGAFLSLQPALAGMRQRGRGRIVAISSIAATDGLAGQAAYAASKAGILGLVRTLALEMAPAGLTVNAVVPGMVETEKVEAMPGAVRERAMARVPLGRFAAPEEVAATVAFLCSDAAAYITGACLPVDGGMSLSNLTLGSER